MVEPVKIFEATNQDIATICDNTFLKTVEEYKAKFPDSEKAFIRRTGDFFAFLDKSVNGPFGFAAVCVRASDVDYTMQFLEERQSPLILAATVGFDYGRASINNKRREAQVALERGADEIDFVIAWEKFIRGQVDYIKQEMGVIGEIVRKYGKKSKAILETAKLNQSQIERACELADEAGIDFVKTSSGYNGGATPEAVRIMKKKFPRGVKASGGINMSNIREILAALSGRDDGYIEFNPERIRIGESSLFKGVQGY